MAAQPVVGRQTLASPCPVWTDAHPGALRRSVGHALAEQPVAEKALVAVLAVCGAVTITYSAVCTHGLLANWSVLAQWVRRMIS